MTGTATGVGDHGVASFPFPAVVGYDDAKLALLLCAVDPTIGGVLLRGDKGTAKSTLARGLASLQPAAPFVELPLGATEDRVVGSVDVGAALDGDGWQVRAGLLAGAHGGVLYVDEVNLLAGHLVDVLLDSAASGIGRIERDGLSHTYPARFVLVGSMNPEEGELRPQLLDRFGLVVDLGGHGDAADRAEAVRRRLAFDREPTAFVERWSSEVAAWHDALADAQAHHAQLPDDIVEQAARLCLELGVETLRADLTLCRAATALARLEGAAGVTAEHLARVAPLALAHRRRRGPFDASAIDPDELGDALDRSRSRPEDVPSTRERSAHGGSDADHGTGLPGEHRDRGDGSPAPSSADGRAVVDSDTPPAPADEPHHDAAGDTDADAQPNGSGAPGPAPDPADAPAPTVTALHLEAPVTDARPAPAVVAALARRPAASVRPGPATGPARAIGNRSVASTDAVTALAPAATMTAAARRRAADPHGAPLAAEDLREPVRDATPARVLVVALDTSASMGAAARIDAAREAVLRLLLDAYQRRERIALVAVGGEEPRVVMQPTASVEVARARLATLSPAGPTPLAAGIALAGSVAIRARADGFDPLVVVVTDGRATAGPEGTPPFDAALAAAERLAADGMPAVVLDTEAGATALGLGRVLAEHLGARHLHLGDLDGAGVERALRTVTIR